MLTMSLLSRIDFVEPLPTSAEGRLVLKDSCVTDVDHSGIEIWNNVGGNDRFPVAETCSPCRADVLCKIKIFSVRHREKDRVRAVLYVTRRMHNTRKTSQSAVAFKEAVDARAQVAGI